MANERSYILRVEEIHRLREQRGLSVESLALKADIHEKTLRRWLKGKPAFIQNVAALAKALGTTSENLIEGASNPQRVRVVLTTTLEIEGFDESQREKFVQELAKRINAAGEIIMTDLEPGSLKITLEMDVDDAIRLHKAFIAGQLVDMGITAIHDADTQTKIGDFYHEGQWADSRNLDPDRKLPRLKPGEKSKKQDD